MSTNLYSLDYQMMRELSDTDLEDCMTKWCSFVDDYYRNNDSGNDKFKAEMASGYAANIVMGAIDLFTRRYVDFDQ